MMFELDYELRVNVVLIIPFGLAGVTGCSRHIDKGNILASDSSLNVNLLL